MPANTLDHRTFAQEQFTDIDPAILAALVAGNYDSAAPTLNLTATAGAALGTSPPAAVVTPGANAVRGNVTFGSGSAPTTGIALTILFPFALTGMLRAGTTTPQAYIFLTPTTQVTAPLDMSAIFTTSGQTVTGFTINVNTAPTASQGNTVYGVNWLVMG